MQCVYIVPALLILGCLSSSINGKPTQGGLENISCTDSSQCQDNCPVNEWQHINYAGCVCKNNKCKVDAGCGKTGAFFYKYCEDCSMDNCEDSGVCKVEGATCTGGQIKITASLRSLIHDFIQKIRTINCLINISSKTYFEKCVLYPSLPRYASSGRAW